MGLKLIYSEFARHDLKEIYDFIREDSLKYAKREISLIKEALNKLKTIPELGKPFEDTENDLTRELIYRRYRIIYEIVSDKQINILTIHHHARSLSNNPAFNDED
ncbi:type II toxin-antitoxin system RelE/ParE family toxin [Mucilaginibacter limnophilus]|uniref:Type II toxin-antitoxin system RelE/ParE family toxin n=1 Tax=Mucilaginibacter limnophilus TaxID=1932778 RepID=A0A437MVU0_9SPHI|nr:type II toxin-antitoxin system RelE/ParE family toxin [Mucilaginibacter limnophilus]RVU01775.1 type II toxin-antitoxin system RelE/ParE family toxin [Mucilaginibacter limnophilus]